MAPRQKPRTTIIRMAGAAFIRPITKLLSIDIVQLLGRLCDLCYCFLAPLSLSFSTQTPPAFSHSVLFFASSIPAKAEAVKAVATAKVTNAKRSLFMVNSPFCGA